MAAHQLDGISWQHVSHSNRAQKAHGSSLPGWDFMAHVSHSNEAQEAYSSSLPGWDFMAACQPFKWSPGGTQQLTSWMGFHGPCQPFKWSPGGTQQLTPWMGFHGSMSAIQMKPRRHTATHKLDGILWQHVSHSNGAQEAHSNSLSGWDFMAACQPFKWSPGGTQQLTPWMGFHGPCQPFKWSPGGTQQLTIWMGFHGSMSAIQMELRRHTATHSLDGILWQHVSHSNGAQEAHSNSQSGWDFMAACQPFKWRPGGAQQLTPWMGFHGSMSAIQMELRRHTQQLTNWMGFHGSMSAIQMEPRRHTATHSLDEISWQHVSHSNGAQEAHSNSLSG